MPPVASKITKPICEDKKLKVEQVIVHIMEKNPIDVMILGEVSGSCSTFLKELARKAEMELIICTENIGKIYFDIAILYEKTKLKFIEKEYLVSKTSSGSSIKCATRF